MIQFIDRGLENWVSTYYLYKETIVKHGTVAPYVSYFYLTKVVFGKAKLIPSIALFYTCRALGYLITIEVFNIVP